MLEAQLRECLEGLPGVVADTVEVATGEVATLRCEVAPGADPTAALGDRLQAVGVMHELAVELPTLEEYFYAITDGADQRSKLTRGAAKGAYTTLKKELLSYAVSPVSWIIAVLFYLVRGFELASIALEFAVFRGDPGQFPSATYAAGSTFYMVLLVPGILTMRCFAEERRTGSIETLMTAPVRDVEVVLGKWLAAAIFFAILWLPSVLVLHVLEQPAFRRRHRVRPGFLVYVGLFLLSGLLLAFGCFASSLTENVLLAAIMTMLSTGLLTQGLEILSQTSVSCAMRTAARELLGAGRLWELQQLVTRGLVDTSHGVYGGIGFFLFLTRTSSPQGAGERPPSRCLGEPRGERMPRAAGLGAAGLGRVAPRLPQPHRHDAAARQLGRPVDRRAAARAP